MSVFYLDTTLLPATTDDVDAERDRRKASGFGFEGHRYQSDPTSLLNLSGAATNASIAIAQNGAQPGDYFWASPEYAFGWIAEDNTVVPIDAPTMVRLAQAAFDWITQCTYAAKTLKERIRDGETVVNVSRDDLWPRTA